MRKQTYSRRSPPSPFPEETDLLTPITTVPLSGELAVFGEDGGVGFGEVVGGGVVDGDPAELFVV